MATATKSRSKGRQHLQKLDQQFPTAKKNVIIFPSNSMAIEVANIRTQRNIEQKKEFDLSGCMWMLPHNRQKVAAELASAQEGRFNWRYNAADRTELKELIIASEREIPSGEKSADIASYRQFEISSDLLAMPFALGAFQSIN